MLRVCVRICTTIPLIPVKCEKWGSRCTVKLRLRNHVSKWVALGCIDIPMGSAS